MMFLHCFHGTAAWIVYTKPSFDDPFVYRNPPLPKSHNGCSRPQEWAQALSLLYSDDTIPFRLDPFALPGCKDER